MSSSGQQPTFPIVMTIDGVTPQTTSSLRAQLLAIAVALSPGLTADLPGALIEDVSSTQVGGLSVCDSAWVDLVNSMTPYGANEFILNDLGQNVYGVAAGQNTNTSVLVVFTGTPGFPLNPGFTVTDGTYQYTLADGVIVPSSGTTAPQFCVATVAGSWAVPANTVTQLVTQLPPNITLSCTNPLAGTPSAGPQSPEDYRAQVLQAGLAASTGMVRFLKTLLSNVAGVQQRLISVVQNNGGGWEVICGGGDPYDVAFAIYEALFDISTLVGSTLSVTGITNANPGVVTTDHKHNYTSGQAVLIEGVVGMTGINGTPITATVLSPTTFSIGFDTTTLGAYVSGGTVTPVLRNVSVEIADYPDTYVVPFVNPPQQLVTMTATWNSTTQNFVSPDAVAQLANPALVTYINSIPAGAPINVFELIAVFQQAVAPLIPTPLLTRLLFAVSIDGVPTSPLSGTGIIPSDPESYFFTQSTDITIAQG